MSAYTMDRNTSFNWADDEDDDWSIDTWKQEHGQVAQPTIEELGPLQQTAKAEPSYDVSRAVNVSPEAADGADAAIFVDYRAIDAEACFAWRRMAVVDGQHGGACERSNYYRDWKQCQYERINYRPKYMRHMSLEPSGLWQSMVPYEEYNYAGAIPIIEGVDPQEHLPAIGSLTYSSDEDTMASTSTAETRATSPSSSNRSCVLKKCKDRYIHTTHQKLNAHSIGLEFFKQPYRVRFCVGERLSPCSKASDEVVAEENFRESSKSSSWPLSDVTFTAAKCIAGLSIGALAYGLARRCISRK